MPRQASPAASCRSCRTLGPMKSRAWVAVLVSVIASALVWALSPLLTGHREPWDADGVFYVAALVVAGSAAGLVAPRPLWAHYLGAIIGQLGYELLFLRIGALFFIGTLFLLGYSVVFVAAAALAGRFHASVRSRAK
jgi:hypothetical protein